MALEIEVKVPLTEAQLKQIALYIIQTGMLEQLIEKKEVPLEEQLLTLRQVANLTGLNPQTINNHIKSGIIKAVKIGSQWRISRKALKDYANGE
ncbi:MAG: helix-turn-helix domain-containing protein [Flavobacteriaceae bacterium]|jgi:excisionase family DNA binding protein|nr:helix-turn-helix domain-containing protein [Flavobacteriaceae bacterium]